MIQVPVVTGGDFAAKALMYKPPSADIMNYMSNKLNNVMSYTHGITDRFKSTLQSLYNKAYNSDVINASKYLLAQSDHTLRQDVIYSVPYHALHEANLIMQRYILAEPTLNNLYRKNMCSGYPDTYFNSEPDTYGKERLDYQRVMDGVMQFESVEGQGELAYVSSYSNSDDIELSHIERTAILDTWHEVVRKIAMGEDPTDQDV